ncbi:phosphate regulon sensor histidine kinase PhoR [Methylococcus capsulatus]|jgi:two-component system phosphate regulon sensor histidine kinase PhoR|uniref:Phosphate regulon sensor protein PhoR n=2 Tax=Methylococcus capsulatus TaxID=414 RepID=A0AA35UDC5_METCP|nr:phosphate regulon sensor histidine kinase PhoR [Methylococcus capsulatus]QXP86499.1 phosphate regulon sensor histidine kinase PhoR [Methylococcus capsulatus]QXP93833.1 phosphate regulon sensor histidine kinase PhoR [Methylococcus capsulatus]CAI8791081.1 Phosphate regulon sensor protein PhoR [Methylococcus capsulatus]
MFRAWASELFTIFWVVLVAVIAGRIAEDFGFALWVGTLLYLLHHLVHANRLYVWMRGGRSGRVPAGTGIWEEIYYLIHKLRRRNKRRKKQLIRMLEQFRTATSALPDATVVLGARDEIDWFNESACRLLGLRKSDLGQNIGNLVRYPKFAEHLKNSRDSATVCIPSPVDEAIQLEVRVVPYGEDSRLLIAQDVTQLRFMERVRSDFVANVSHELRTPLTVLKGYMETLNEGGQDLPPSAYRKMVQRMVEQTGRMQSLVDNLLSLTRLESGPPKPAAVVRVPALLERLCKEANVAEANEHTPVRLILDSQVSLLGNEIDLHSAFANLVSNAIKYSRPSDTVTVRWSQEESGAARLDVEDTGPGIPKEHIPRLTERFYRVEIEGCRNKSGTGLGLAIVKHVMSRHDAELLIASELGRGSRFTCLFPSSRVVPGADRGDPE